MRASASRPAAAFLALAAPLLAVSCAKRIDPGVVAGGAALSGSPAEAPAATRLLITRASLEVVVSSVPEAVEKAVALVEQAGGWVQESATEKDGDARLQLRVPAQHLAATLDDLARLGEEKRRHLSSEDVTERVADLDAELTNKKALRDRLRQVLGRAASVKDVLAVETELARVQTEIDSLEGRLERMREDVAFSALDLRLNQRERRPILGPLGYLYVGTKWFITKLFVIRPSAP